MTNGINWSEMFPSSTTVWIFVAYISLFISQGILVTASQDKSNRYDYNVVSVVLLTEALKLIISIALYCRSDTLQSLLREIKKNIRLCLLYLIPSFLYCIYNNLAFTNLSTFDPTTYYLLLQLRVVVTGVLFQIIFKKNLTSRQWMSLLLLTLGCMVKQVTFDSFFAVNEQSASPAIAAELAQAESIVHRKKMNGFDMSLSAVYIVIQLICSCLAGVYNEHLLKGSGAETNIYVQNVFMYIDSIFCNVILIILQGNFSTAFNGDALKSVFAWNVILIMFNNAAVGIVTCLFLKYLNSILKTFASALELVFTAILCYFLFDLPIHFNTVLSISIVSLAIYLYSLSPVVNAGDKQRQRKQHQDDDIEQNAKLLHTDSDTV